MPDAHCRNRRFPRDTRRKTRPRRLLARLFVVGVFTAGCIARATDRAETVAPSAPSAGYGGPASTTIAGDAVAGRDKAESERCPECHGPAGGGTGRDGNADGKFPRLAGQYPAYIVKQFGDFRAGRRTSDAMAVMADTLDEADLLDIAAFFAAQPRMPGESRPASRDGQRLYFSGDPARGITACCQCHGETGQGGIGPQGPVPLIAGQQWRYLDKQLRDWRSGERRNSPEGVMNRNAQALTDPEIESLADFIAGL